MGSPDNVHATAWREVVFLYPPPLKRSVAPYGCLSVVVGVLDRLLATHEHGLSNPLAFAFVPAAGQVNLFACHDPAIAFMSLIHSLAYSM